MQCSVDRNSWDRHNNAMYRQQNRGPEKLNNLSGVTKKVAELGFSHRQPSCRGGVPAHRAALLFMELRVCPAFAGVLPQAAHPPITPVRQGV